MKIIVIERTGMERIVIGKQSRWERGVVSRTGTD